MAAYFATKKMAMRSHKALLKALAKIRAGKSCRSVYVNTKKWPFQISKSRLQRWSKRAEPKRRQTKNDFFFITSERSNHAIVISFEKEKESVGRVSLKLAKEHFVANEDSCNIERQCCDELERNCKPIHAYGRLNFLFSGLEAFWNAILTNLAPMLLVL